MAESGLNNLCTGQTDLASFCVLASYFIPQSGFAADSVCQAEQEITRFGE